MLQVHALENIQNNVSNSSRSLNSAESSKVAEDQSTLEELETVSVNVNGEQSSSSQYSPSLSQAESTSSPSVSSIPSSNIPSAITAPQKARARIAKFTATLIGAAGSIGAYGSSINDESTCDGLTFRELEDQFIGLKIREADTLAELKEMRQRVMELETQVN